MRAYQILMFMLTVNFGIFIIQSVPIYNMGFEPLWANSSAILAISVASVFAGLTGGFAVAFFSRNATAMQYSVYIVFSSAFWGLYASTLYVFDGITSMIFTWQGVNYVLYTGITVIIGLIFAVGLMQMITGGWKGLY